MSDSRLQRWIQVQDPLTRDLFREIIRRLDGLDIDQETGAAIDTIETNVSTLQTDITTLQDEMNDAQSDINAAQSDINALEGDAMLWQDTYNALLTYSVNDVVIYSGAAYICILAGLGQTPDASPTYWTALGGGASTAVFVPKRQTALDGEINSSGKAEYIYAGTGLAVDVSVALVPLVIAFAAGFDASGAVDYIGRVSATPATAWTALQASKTSYLYIDRDVTTGALTYGQTTSYPFYRKGTAASITAHPRQCATAGTALASSGTAANAFDQEHAVNTEWVSGETGLGVSGVSYIGYDFGAGVTKRIRRVVMTKLSSIYNVSSVKAQWSSDGATWTDIETITLDTATNSHEVLEIDSYTAARYFRLLANANLTAPNAWRVNKLILQEIPDDAHWFDVSGMAMYAWNSGTSAWEAKQRVFVGEATTDATTVLTAYSYAFAGDFDSDWFPASTTSPSNDITLEHAIGLPLSQGLSVEVHYSTNGTDLDVMIPNDLVYIGAYNGFRYHRLSSPLTQYQDTRMYLYLSIANSVAYYGELKSQGWFRVRVTRKW